MSLEYSPTPAALRRIEEKLRQAEPGEAVQVTQDETAAIIADRNSIHGDFDDDATVSQCIKAAMRTGKNWGELTAIQTEALEMIATKIGRILSGDPNHKDHYTDIQGYARLVSDRL